MGTKKTYRSKDIKSLDVAALLVTITSSVVVSIDVAKAGFVAAIHTEREGVIRILRFEHPTETSLFLDLVTKLIAKLRMLTVAPLVALMEPTGTYGDALRYQIEKLGAEVRMVQPKRTHDAKEVFDGLPSKHDPKDAVTMAKLHAAGASAIWKSPDEPRRAIRAMLDQHATHASVAEAMSNRIEARLARHWPEFERWLCIRKHRSARALLQRYVTPQAVAADPDGARELLQCASRGFLAPQLVEGVIQGASKTLGVPMIAAEETALKDLLKLLEREENDCDEIEKRLFEATKNNAGVASMARILGVAAACAVFSCLGSPANYPSSRAFLKAAGLSMREDSSGTEKSNVHITKRGPAVVRKLLYMAALRSIANEGIERAWYCNRNAHRSDNKAAAVVALMRKLLAGAYHLGKHHVEYDPTKLFDVRRLTLKPVSERERPKPRTEPRSIARSARRTRGANKGGGAATAQSA